MIYVRQPADEEERELRPMMRQEVGRGSQRAHMVPLSAARYSVPEIAELLDVCRATGRARLRQFDAEGPSGLYDDPRSGHPRKLDQRVEATAIDLLRTDPQQAG